jgi:hypothetical protein
MLLTLSHNGLEEVAVFIPPSHIGLLLCDCGMRGVEGGWNESDLTRIPNGLLELCEVGGNTIKDKVVIVCLHTLPLAKTHWLALTTLDLIHEALVIILDLLLEVLHCNHISGALHTEVASLYTRLTTGFGFGVVISNSNTMGNIGTHIEL